jgi:hypothetical protein
MVEEVLKLDKYFVQAVESQDVRTMELKVFPEVAKQIFLEVETSVFRVEEMQVAEVELVFEEVV